MQDPINSEDRVQRILSGVGRRRCALESFRDGRIIDGYNCRLTIGRLALMGIAECKIFSCATDVELSGDDVLAAWWFTIEDNIDNAVNVADDSERLQKEVERIKRGRTEARLNSIIDEVQGWLVDVSDAMPQTSEDGEQVIRVDWWADALDMLASQYHWSEEFILWYLPLVRAIKYQERICARSKGESVSDDISEDIVSALEELKEIKGKENG